MTRYLLNTEKAKELHEEEAVGYLRTAYDCPGCGSPGDVEGDATGEVCVCEECGEHFRISHVL